MGWIGLGADHLSGAEQLLPRWHFLASRDVRHRKRQDRQG